MKRFVRKWGGFRVLVTTLTKRMVEDSTDIWSMLVSGEVHAFRNRCSGRMEILRDRVGKLRCAGGINRCGGVDLARGGSGGHSLMRIRKVSRSERSLADYRSGALMWRKVIRMRSYNSLHAPAIDETNRRRSIQMEYNRHGITSDHRKSVRPHRSYGGRGGAEYQASMFEGCRARRSRRFCKIWKWRCCMRRNVEFERRLTCVI